MRKWPGLGQLPLRGRLALSLALAAVVPLLLAMLLVGQRQGETLRAEALSRQQRQAWTLASAIEDYVNLHRAAVNALAAQPALLDLPAGAQRTQLKIVTQAFPDITSTALFDAEGNQVRRSDEITSAIPVRGYPVYELARQSNQPSLDILQSPVLNQPIFAFGAPVHGPSGNFAGLVVAALPSTHMVDFIAQQGANREGPAFLIDSHGRVIAQADPALMASFADLSAAPGIGTMLNGGQASGSLTYTGPAGEQLAGYARVGDLGWTVIVERPASEALAGLYHAQLGTLEILAGGLVITAVAGYILAGRITAPVRALLGEIREFGDDPAASPVQARLAAPPAGRPFDEVPEITDLMAAFREMRDRLATRTAEREEEMHVRVQAEASLRQAIAALTAHEEALKQANEGLEAQVASRTEDLRRANDQLRAELAERQRAEASLQESEERYRRLVESAPMGIMVHDGQTITYLNPAGAALLGAGAPAEITGRPLLDFVHPDCREHVLARARQVIDLQTNAAPMEQQMLRLDRSPVAVVTASAPAKVAGRQAVQVVILDISVRKRVEAERERLLSENREQRELLERRVQERTQELAASAESLAQANRRLHMLYDIDQAILAARSPAEIAQAALERIGQVIACDRASILLIEQPERRVRFLATAGILLPHFDPEDVFGIDDWDVPADLQQGAVHESTDLTHDGNPAALSQALLDAGLRRRIQAPLFVGGRLIGSLNLLTCDPNGLQAPAPEIAAQVALSLAIAIQNAQLDEQVHASRAELQALNRRMVELQENERRAIARELHDEAGQALATLMIGLGLIEREAGQPEAVLARVAELKQTTDTVLGDLHDLAVDLRPASLDRLGLLPALRQLIDSYRRQTGLDVVLESVGIGPAERFPPELETTIYRVVQEALTNVARHANATYAGILVERRTEALIGIVEDNGVGFQPNVVQERGRLGLLGMRERAEMVGGRLTIESAPGLGTTVFVEVPLSQD